MESMEDQRYVKNLLDLNEDCLQEIFEYLEAPDQNQVRKVCPRFNEIIQQIWRRTKILKIDYQWDYEKSQEDFINYIEVVSGVAVKVTFCPLPTTHKFNKAIYIRSRSLINMLQTFIFSNAQELSFHGCVEACHLLGSFPKLKKLELKVFSASPFLSCTYCLLTDQNAFQSLESLDISGKISKVLPNCNGIRQMRNLREIIISHTDLFANWFSELSEVLENRVIHTFAGRVDIMNAFRMPDVKILMVPLFQKSWKYKLLHEIRKYKTLEVLYIYGHPLDQQFIEEFEKVLANTRISKEPLRVTYVRKPGSYFAPLFPTKNSKFMQLSSVDKNQCEEVASDLNRVNRRFACKIQLNPLN
uniref:F-box domain-containing protein n=1 Tax=Glossina brevipalpis TaxID=37001 RepID=A0A1A9X4G3_9MUSC